LAPFAAAVGAIDRRLRFIPRTSRTGIPANKPVVPGDSRNLNDRPNRPEVFRRANTEEADLQALRPRRQRPRRASRAHPASSFAVSASRVVGARKRRVTLASAGRLLSQCELDGLVPRHGSSLVESSAGSRLAEPGPGWNEVALAPRLG